MLTPEGRQSDEAALEMQFRQRQDVDLGEARNPLTTFSLSTLLASLLPERCFLGPRGGMIPERASRRATHYDSIPCTVVTTMYRYGDEKFGFRCYDGVGFLLLAHLARNVSNTHFTSCTFFAYGHQDVRRSSAGYAHKDGCASPDNSGDLSIRLFQREYHRQWQQEGQERQEAW